MIENLRRTGRSMQTNWFMWSHRNQRIELDDGTTIPGPKGFPAPWAWTHLCKYFCDLTGGCSYGPLRSDSSGTSRKVRFCWKCQGTWANPLETQDDRPWRHTPRWLLPVEALRWHTFQASLDRIKRNGKPK